MQSYHHGSSGFDKMFDENTFSDNKEQRFLHGMVVKMHDDEYEDCSLH